ncbi:MAG: ribonuclease domain-containing protein [Pseudomonadota bacterium]|nr:ribonuclease domain-containing protein [Pseudomonadota bacterium]
MKSPRKKRIRPAIALTVLGLLAAFILLAVTALPLEEVAVSTQAETYTSGSLPNQHTHQDLPAEAWRTVALIQRGGPYPYRQDGTVFGNREQLLPGKPRGYYREYTVETPGLRHRGARRIVTGGQPPDVWYYSDDHYQSFRKFTP